MAKQAPKLELPPDLQQHMQRSEQMNAQAANMHMNVAAGIMSRLVLTHDNEQDLCKKMNLSFKAASMFMSLYGINVPPRQLEIKEHSDAGNSSQGG